MMNRILFEGCFVIDIMFILKVIRSHFEGSYNKQNLMQRLFCMKFTIFLRYTIDFFPFQNNPKNLDPSYKTDLDL